MDERNQDFKNLGLIFSSRWGMTMTDIILHNNSADKNDLLKKDKTQQLIRSCCVIMCQTPPTGVSQTTRLHFKVSIIDWVLFQKWGRRWGRFGWETAVFLCVDELRRSRPTGSDWHCVWLASNLRREQRGRTEETICGDVVPTVSSVHEQTEPVSSSLMATSACSLRLRATDRGGEAAVASCKGLWTWCFFLCGLWFSAHCSLTQWRVCSLEWRILHILYTHTVHAYTHPNHTARSQGVFDFQHCRDVS